MNAKTTNNLHHPFGPSVLERRALCPGSYRMEKDLPEVTSEAAKEGTNLHALTAEAVNAFAKGEYREEAYPVEVRTAIEMLSGIEIGAKAEIGAECLLSYKQLGVEAFFGTADVVIINTELRKAWVIDWKFGFLPVEDAADNYQGAAYALCVHQNFAPAVDSVEVHFFNPRIGQHTAHTFTDFAGVSKSLLKVIGDCKNPDAPVNASEQACKYCKAFLNGTCPTIAKSVTALTETAEKLMPLPSLEELTPESLCELKEKLDILSKLSDRVDNRIKAVATELGTCGCWTTRTTSGGREIADINGAYSCIEQIISPAEMLECSTLSVSKLEKLFAKKLKEQGITATEKEAKTRFANVLADYLSDKPARVTLVKVKTDK